MHTPFLRLILPALFLSFCISCVYGQTLAALYKATMKVNPNREDGYDPKIPDLEFHCMFYQKGSRYISFLKPLYLEKYKQGLINYDVPNSGSNHFHVYHLNMDTLIAASYIDTDSLIWRFTSYSNASNNQKPMYYTFERGWQRWDILPETKMISGLQCQRARLMYSSGKTGWDLWFCPDIPVGSNISNILELPGLVVEAEELGGITRYQLESYVTGLPIDDKVFWPELFNKPFRFSGHLKKK